MTKLNVVFVLAVLVLLVHATARNTPSDVAVDDKNSNTKNVDVTTVPKGGAGVKDKKCAFGFAGVGGYAGVGTLGGIGGLGGASGLGGLGGLGAVGLYIYEFLLCGLLLILCFTLFKWCKNGKNLVK